MKTSELNSILKNHQLWLDGEIEGKKADLSEADLSGANLSGADLSGANLSEANLLRANLSWANLSWANLSEADLSEANLSRANLSEANLSRANLSEANLSWANLSRANLSEADLSWADLSKATLSRADLSGADLSKASLPTFKILPEVGDFIGYKKLQGEVVVKVKITGERVNSLVGRKCRCSKMEVMEVVCNPLGLDFCEDDPLHGTHYKGRGYYVGAVLEEPEFDNDIRIECAKGLHFFLTLQEARRWR